MLPFDPALLTMLFPAFLVLLALFILREVFAWYFKINKVIKLLEKIEENTRPAGTSRESEPPAKKPAPSLFANYKDQGVDKKGFFG